MATFITGLVILLLGGYLYGKFVEHVFKPDDRETPAVRMKDGIDYVPMNKECIDQPVKYRRYRTYFWTYSRYFIWTDCFYHHSNRMCDQRCHT